MSDDEKHLDLTHLQSWLQMVSTHPSGLEEGIRLAQRGVGLGDDQLEEIVQSGYGIDAKKRVGIYHRGYFTRLLECLRAEYAVLSKAFSGEWFEKMGLRYLAQCPSNSWTLADLGARFPDFLERDRPDSDAAPADRTPAFDFIVELARLERTVTEISRGPGIEGTDLSAFDGLEHRKPDGIRFVISPSLRLLRSQFALCHYFEAARKNEEVAFPEAQPQCIALCRFDYRVYLYEVEAWQFDLLGRLTEDGRLAKALASITEQHPDGPISARWPVWLALCAERGFFAAVESQ